MDLAHGVALVVLAAEQRPELELVETTVELGDRLRQLGLDRLVGLLAGEQREVTWGSQIRSYVLAPYQLVKDVRTEHETGNVQAVLDGDLDGFMEAYLRWRRSSAP